MQTRHAPLCLLLLLNFVTGCGEPHQPGGGSHSATPASAGAAAATTPFEVASAVFVTGAVNRASLSVFLSTSPAVCSEVQNYLLPRSETQLHLELGSPSATTFQPGTYLWDGLGFQDAMPDAKVAAVSYVNAGASCDVLTDPPAGAPVVDSGEVVISAISATSVEGHFDLMVAGRHLQQSFSAVPCPSSNGVYEWGPTGFGLGTSTCAK